MMSTNTDNLIKVVEVWVPNESGDRLQLSSATYGELTQFGESSRSLTFARGEPFPGHVWESRSPLILPDLYTNEFKRAEAARAAGLTSGLAIPIVEGDDLRAVILLLCDQAQGAQGAFEVWKRDDRQELGLASEYYANLNRFSTISRHIKFPRGAGLPGGIWDDEFPRIINGLTPSSGFARASGTGAQDLNVAVGLPVMRGMHTLDSVILILSAKPSPMARGFQIWGISDDKVTRHQSAFSFNPVTEQQPRSEQKLAEQVAESRLPIIQNGDHADSACAENSWSLGVPIFIDRELRAILTILN